MSIDDDGIICSCASTMWIYIVFLVSSKLIASSKSFDPDGSILNVSKCSKFWYGSVYKLIRESLNDISTLFNSALYLYRSNIILATDYLIYLSLELDSLCFIILYLF